MRVAEFFPTLAEAQYYRLLNSKKFLMKNDYVAAAEWDEGLAKHVLSM